MTLPSETRRTRPGDIRSPNIVNGDVSFEKRAALGAGAILSLRVELINLFNGVNWVGPRSVFGRSDFVRIPAIVNADSRAS